MNPVVAVAQMNCALGKLNRNIEKIEKLTARAAKREADFACFPELATTGYLLGRAWREHADTVPGRCSDKLGQIARQYGLYMISGVDELDKRTGRIHDSSMLLAPNGEVAGIYRKVHLWDRERHYFTPGREFPVFSTRFGKVGLGICYDLEFPEPARIMALEGARIIFYSSAQMKPMQTMVDTYVRGRAGENALFVCHSNRVGREEALVFFGQSQIVHPTCKPLAKLREAEGLAVAKLDLQEVQKLRRNKLPYLQQRVPRLYSALTDRDWTRD